MMKYERICWYALTVFLLEGVRQMVDGSEFDALIVSVALRLSLFMCVVYAVSKAREAYDRRSQVR